MKYKHLHCDFETKSAADLSQVGTDNYSRHPTTDALCVGFAFDDEPVDLLQPEDFIFAPFLDYIREGGELLAYNAPFEIAIWNNVMVPKYGWPKLDPAQCTCVMAMSYAQAMPGKLEHAAPAAGISFAKDMAGHRVMMQLSQPKEILADGTPVWREDPEKKLKLYEYCKQDIVVERALFKRLCRLSPYEKKIWALDFDINNRGIYVDVPSVKKAIEIVEEEKKSLNNKMREVTDNFVATATAVGQLKDFISMHGIELDSVDKNSVASLLKKDLPPKCKEALTIRQEAGKSSTAKLEKMLSGVSSDGRLRGMFQYSGATTRRWAGRRVQLHNLPRPKLKQADIDDIFELFNVHTQTREMISMFYGPPLSVISDCLRGFLSAPHGRELIAADYSNIEGRVLAWLAGEKWKIEAFEKFDRGELPDIYIQGYSRSFHIPLEEVTDAQRQIGKVQELALGFGGGKGAFQLMAKGYGVTVSEERAEEIKKAWRAVHPATVNLWYRLEEAAMGAVLNHGRIFEAGKISYKVNGSFLWCRLPSGGVLCYPYPKIEPIMKPWGQATDSLTFMGMNPETNKWERMSTYGGSLAENCTQATARDLLADAMLRINSEATPVVLHVHDEIVCEVEKGSIDVKSFEQKMSEVPTWAKGMPIVAKGTVRKRYGK